MTTKKKDVAKALGVDEEVVSEDARMVDELPRCKHVNRQHFNIQGFLEDVACELPAGHDGDHSAKVRVLRKNPYTVKNPNAEYLWREGAEYEITETKTEWSNAAGTPADKIEPDYEGLTREEWVQKRRAKALAGNA